MIEMLKGFPDNVAAFAYHGQVTKSDLDQVLIPDFEDRLRRHKKLRIYFEIAPDLEGFDSGAVWESMHQKFGFGHFFDWKRCAVVTDVSWAKDLAKFSELFGFLWPGKYRAFSEAEADKARDGRHNGNLSTRFTTGRALTARRGGGSRRARTGSRFVDANTVPVRDQQHRNPPGKPLAPIRTWQLAAFVHTADPTAAGLMLTA